MSGDELGESSESRAGSESKAGSESGDSDADEDSGVDEERELADLDPNAEKAARKVERQLRRLHREMRG